MSIKGLSKEFIDNLIIKLEEQNWQSFSENNQYFYIGYKKDNWVVKIWVSKNGYTLWSNVPNEIDNIIKNKIIDENDFNIIIEVDDSGWGSPIGSTCIGIYNITNQEYKAYFLPISDFQSPHFQNKRYLISTSNIIQQYMESNQFNIIKNRVLIKICTGYIFTNAVKDLSKQNYNVKRSKIEGKLQSLVENSFNEYLLSIIRNYNQHFSLLLNSEPTDQDRKSFFYKLVTEIKNHKELLKHSKTGWKYFERNKKMFE